jgi:hypothetical protein
MTDHEKRLLRSLAWMCHQYLQSPDGSIDHHYVSAGEDAASLLVEYGLLKPDARGGQWTEAGMALLASN